MLVSEGMEGTHVIEMRPENVLMLAAGLLAGLFFVAGSIQALGRHAWATFLPRRRRRRRVKPVPCGLLCDFLKALQTAPDDVRIWYELGVSLSRLNHQKEAKVALQYVVRRGDPNSEEASLARQWLVTPGTPAKGAASPPEVLPDQSRTMSALPPIEPAGPGEPTAPVAPAMALEAAWPGRRPTPSPGGPQALSGFPPGSETGESWESPEVLEPPSTEAEHIKMVVHYADGRVIKGFSYDFYPNKPHFHLLPPVAGFSFTDEALEVRIKELKAVFFVRDFKGNPSYNERKYFLEGERPPGRKVEVTFRDGEVLVGSTVGYDMRRPGFFFIPADPKSNNLKVFAVRRAVTSVRFL